MAKRRRLARSASVKRRHRTGAGAATFAGTTFQENVAAWLAIQILAEQATSPGFGLPERVTLEELRAESFQPVDDLHVRTSVGGSLYFQCKTTIALSPRPESGLSTVVRQFVGQFIAGDRSEAKNHRPLRPECDRLILVVGETAPASIARDLAGCLEAMGSATTVELMREFQSLRNDKQNKALSLLRSHFQREWDFLTGTTPTDDDWLLFVQLVRVCRFSFSDEGEQRRTADTLLRSQILREPRDSQLAWAEVLKTVRAFAPARLGGDRVYFRDRLSRAGVGLQAARGFRDDVEALRRYTHIRLASLARHSRIVVRGRELRIARPCVEALCAMAADGPLLVVGEPGAGKSGCLHEFANRVFADGWGCVLLEAEHLDATSIPALSRDLGLTAGRTLVDVLSNWPTRPTPDGREAARYLIVDALDAARGKLNLLTFCDLVRDLQIRAPGWIVVASIREFDLRHSDGLQELFEGRPHSEFREPLFERIRHLYVRRLTDSELDSAQEQLRELAIVVRRGSRALVELVRNPFNLKLLAELVSADVPPDDLLTVRVQVELLERYWDKRVGPDVDGSVDEAINALISGMKAARELSVDRARLTGVLTANAPALSHLFAQGLLRREQRMALPGASVFFSFAHNIIFDYALARCWLKDLSGDVVQELGRRENQDLLLFARPSIVLAFHRLWHLVRTPTASRELFWRRAIGFTGASGLRLIGRIVAATSAASEFRGLDDIEYLFDRIESDASAPAGLLLNHVVGAALAQAPATTEGILGPSARPWLSVARAIGERGLIAHAWQIRMLILAVQTAKAVRLTPEQAVSANRAALSLLRWSAAERALRPALPTAVSVACRTLKADFAPTLAALESLIEVSRSEEWYETLQPLAEYLGRIATGRPRLAARIVRAAFSKQYDREDRYNMGGRLLPMAFSKQDVLDSVRRQCGKSLAGLSQRRPVTAAYLVLVMMRSAMRAEGRKRSIKSRTARIAFRGRTAIMVEDYSSIWGDREYSAHAAWRPALVALRQLLERLASGDGTDPRLGRVLDLFARYGRPAIVWNTLLRVAHNAPASLGVMVAELLMSRAVLIRSDTSVMAGRLLPAVWPFIAPDARVRIEKAVLSLPRGARGEQREWLVERRGRLLQSLPEGAIEMPEARAILSESRGEVPSATDVPPHSARGLRAISVDERLRMEGIDVHSEPNREIREWTKRVEELKTLTTSERVGVDDLQPLFSALTALRHGLNRMEAGTSPEVSRMAEAAYYEALPVLAGASGLWRDQEVAAAVERLLLDASFHPVPNAPSPDEDRPGGFAAWGGGQPRIEAAAGLVALARGLPAGKSRLELFAALRRLARDPHWAVRFQVVAHANALWNANRDLMWEIIEDACRSDSDLRVLRFLSHTLVSALRGTDTDRIDSLLTLVQERVRDVDEGEQNSIATAISGLTMWRVIVQDHEPSRARIAAWVEKPLDSFAYLQDVIHHSRAALVLDAVGGDQEEALRVRAWAFSLLRSILERLVAMWQELKEANSGRTGDWPETETLRARLLYRMADNVANQVYFASGAFDRKFGGSEDEASARTPHQIARFFVEGRSLFEQLCNCPFLTTAHDALKTLAFLVPQDPPMVFRLIRRCVFSAREDFIQNESLAADLVVAIVERYLAEHRDIFRASPELLEALLDILDLFVEAGWLQATRLTYRLDEVFR